MRVRFSYFYYTIYFNADELKLEPHFLSNYFYNECYFLPKLIKQSEPYIFKGQLINKLYPSKSTAEYPYYYSLNQLIINFTGKLEKLTKVPTIFKGFVDSDNNIVISNTDNFPKPLDVITIGTNIYKLGKDFTFDYDYTTRQLILYKLTASE